MKRHLSILACLLLVFAMVLTLASCEWILPKEEHTHDFQDGKCECGEVDPDYKPECTEHAWSAEVTTEATCTEPGEKTLTCTECGATEKQEIAANGHTEENVPGQAPTCLAPGLTSGKKCSVCGVTLKAQDEIPTSGHNFVEGACSVCGEVDPNYNGPRTYVFESITMTQFAAGEKADGETELVGTKDFFKLIYSAKTKVDTTSNKEWEDGYAIGADKVSRLAWAASSFVNDAENGTKNVVEITVDNPTVVKVWWICGGDSRQVAIYNADGSIHSQSNIESVKNTPYLSEFSIEAAGTYYIGNVGGANYFIKLEAVVTPAEEAPANEIKVVTTDTYGWFDEYTFVAEKSGKYTFTVPADLGLYSVASYDARRAPEVDYLHYEYTSEPHTVTVALAAGAEYKFYVGAFSKAEWIITWTCEEGDVGGGDDPVDPPVDNNPVLNLGSNSVKVDEAHVTDGVDYTFVAEVDGTYTFGGDLLAIVFDETGTQQIGRGQVSLTAGTYIVKLVPLMGAGTYNVRVSVESAGQAGEPDGSEENPYVWETIPESVTLDYTVVSGKVYYIFTATADGAVTFTWPVEGDSWFDYFELDENGNLVNNSGSGFMATSHSIVVEAGKSYRVSIGSWAEAGSHTITIAFAACDHEWSEATCQVLSTCSKCGATTGDYADHIPNSENPTCSDPAECTVCGEEVGYVPHEWDDGVVTQQPDCANGTNGIKLLTCTVCGATQEEEIWAYHSWDYSGSVDATCTTDGVYHAVCTVCEYVDTYATEAYGHSNWYLSCGESGECMNCGEEFTLEHTVDPCEGGYCFNCWTNVEGAHNYVDGVCSACGEPAPVEELKATIDNEFTSDKVNNVVILYNKYGAWGVDTNGSNKSEAGAPVGNIGGLDKADKYVAYEFYLSEAGTVDIVWSIAGSQWQSSTNSNIGLTDMGNHMTVTIDGEVINIGGIELLPGEGDFAWWNLQQIVIKDIQLDAGVHTFYCDIAADGAGLNVGPMSISSTSEIDVVKAVVTNVDLVEKDEKIYYAFAVDMVGYDASDVLVWSDGANYEIAAVEIGANGETILLIDVTDLAGGTKINPHMSFGGKNYVNNANANGDVCGGSVTYEAKIVEFNGKYYNLFEEWSMPSLDVIEGAVSSITAADIIEENGKVYYVLTYTVIGYDPATFEFFDGDTVYAVESYDVNGTTVIFKMDITNCSAVWPHLRIDGTPWNGTNGDVKITVTEKSISLNGKTYTLKTQYSMPTVVIA